MLKEARGWRFAAGGDAAAAVAALRSAADQEDAVEKLPVTPGPIVPAREQLALLLLSQHHPDQAQAEFKTALALAPHRRGGEQGLAAARAATAAPRPAA